MRCDTTDICPGSHSATHWATCCSNRVISWLPASLAVVVARRRFRQQRKRGNSNMRWGEKGVLTVANNFFLCFVLALKNSNWFSWSSSFSSCISISVVLSLKRRCAVSTAHVYPPLFPTTYLQQPISQSVSHNVSSAPTCKSGMCLHSSQPCWLHYRILWMELWVSYSLNWHSVSFTGFTKMLFAEEEKL